MLLWDQDAGGSNSSTSTAIKIQSQTAVLATSPRVVFCGLGKGCAELHPLILPKELKRDLFVVVTNRSSVERCVTMHTSLGTDAIVLVEVLSTHLLTGPKPFCGNCWYELVLWLEHHKLPS